MTTKKEIARAYLAATGGRVDTFTLAGPRNTRKRAALYSLITGTKQPIAKSGINAIEKALFELFNVQGNCLAAKWDSLRINLDSELSE